MNKIITLILLFGYFNCKSQIETVYSTDTTFLSIVSQTNAKFVRIQTFSDSGTIFQQIKSLFTNEIISQSVFKDKEQFGTINTLVNGKEVLIDYNFDLIYTKEKCCDSFDLISCYGCCDKEKLSNHINLFEDNDSIHYKAPKIKEAKGDFDTWFFKYVFDNTVYPRTAKQNEHQGKVLVHFIISKEGIVKDVKIKKGAYIELDKEAVRIIKILKFDNGAEFQGRKMEICFEIPILFQLEE